MRSTFGNIHDGVPRRRFLERSLKGGAAIIAGPAVLGVLSSCGRSRFARVPGGVAARRLQRAVSGFRRLDIAHIPTPFEEMKKLSAELGGPRIFMKRDDATGLAFGGNKTRKLEFIIADAVEKDADMIITWAGVQSNWCRQTAAAAALYGITPVLVLSKSDYSPVQYDGNLLLDEILGADVRFVEPDLDREKIVDGIVEEAAAKGRNPYVVPVGGSRVGGSMTQPLGAVGYANAYLEIHNDAQQRRLDIDYIVHATGSGGTQSGLEAGSRALDADTRIVGISVGSKKERGKKGVAEITNVTLKTLGVGKTVTPDDIIIFDEYFGEGYGILNEETADAIRLTARTEGILLDPVYTGKAMAGLIDLSNKGYFKRGDTVVFVHTGGTPALFPYKEQLLDYIRDMDSIRKISPFLPY